MTMERILIVKTSALGDLIHTYPVIAYLHQKFPSAQIDWVVEAPYAELVRAHPYITKTLTVTTKQWRRSLFSQKTWKEITLFRRQLRKKTYDLVIDLQGNIKSGLITAQALSKQKLGFASASVPEWPNLLATNHRFNPVGSGNIRQDYLSIVAQFFDDPLLEMSGAIKLLIDQEKANFVNQLIHFPHIENKFKVIVCSGSAWKNKQLNTETLKALLLLMKNYLNCAFIFAWGSQEEQQIAQELHADFIEESIVADKMSLATLQNLMSQADLVLAMDSLPLHLAGTTETPTFSVFGASSAIKYKPIGKQHFAFQGKCPYGKTFVKRCPILRSCSTGACIRDLQASMIFKEFQSWWLQKNDSVVD